MIQYFESFFPTLLLSSKGVIERNRFITIYFSSWNTSVYFLMMWMLLLLLIAPTVLSYNKHISYSELLKCKEFQGPADYNYEQFLDIMNFDHNRPSNGEVFRIKLYVMSTKDVWMLLSPSTNLTEDAHEIGRFLLNNLSDSDKMKI